MNLRRRDFITLVGGAAAVWPLAARAQQSKIPVIGFLHAGSPEAFASRVAGFRSGLSDSGYTEGRNVAIEYRWAYNKNDKLPELAADLVRRQVAVIATPGGGVDAAPAAKAATSIIPIVFSTGADPVQLGLVASLNRPGGNVTGFNDLNTSLGPKRFGILHQFLPGATRIAALIDPVRPDASSSAAELQAAAASVGRKIEVLYAGSSREIDTTFESFPQKQIEAVLVQGSPLFNSRRIQLITLASHYRVPAIYPWREAVDVGGLMFYGSSGTEEYRQVGIYSSRILKGEKPADLPVMRASKFELIINLQTARTLGLEVPPSLLAIADEVIE
jgi:putative tryptophan/tyrosine transport system substrate-binding protein